MRGRAPNARERGRGEIVRAILRYAILNGMKSRVFRRTMSENPLFFVSMKEMKGKCKSPIYKSEKRG
jgi:hypothetical protein